MDVGLWSGIVGAAAGAIAVPIAWYYGHRSSASGKPRIQVRMVGEYVTYELPGNGGLKMDQFVILKAYNLGDRPVTIVGWGLKLPGSSGNRAVFDSPKSLETQLPYRLEPGDIPAKFFFLAQKVASLGQVHPDVPYERMVGYVRLADDTDVFAAGGVPMYVGREARPRRKQDGVST
ncbi:hypothetical protein [Actinospica robiniae]|uniref:hypothetical protein n=1 Tax=Actinospica robiniae TaxID=304901 RepID=UPI00054EDA47|nr:hypothetical protein [Actinospica robiniae]